MVAAGLVAALLTGPAPLALAADPDDPGRTAVEQAEQAARAADARVDAALARVAQLTDQYSQAQGQVSTAVGGLAGSFTAGVRADRELDQRRRELGQARAERARTVRAIYSSGGQLAIVASVLESSTGEEALTRATESHRVLRDLASERARRVQRLSVRVAEASAAVADAGTADDQHADAVNTANTAADQADRTLAEAAAILQGLQGRAADLSQQAEAARQARQAALDAAKAAAARARAAAVAGARAAEIPDDYGALYRSASATCPGLRWTLLAAVGQVESGHGRNNGPSSAGAIGPMQFMPGTFASYGVDGDADGIVDAFSPADAIFSAARYLCASGYDGTPAGDQRALLAYNHAQWYVDLVLATERKIVELNGA
jgi:membrane-bound lytic murein transglycosylase B